MATTVDLTCDNADSERDEEAVVLQTTEVGYVIRPLISFFRPPPRQAIMPGDKIEYYNKIMVPNSFAV